MEEEKNREKVWKRRRERKRERGKTERTFKKGGVIWSSVTTAETSARLQETKQADKHFSMQIFFLKRYSRVERGMTNKRWVVINNSYS